MKLKPATEYAADWFGAQIQEPNNSRLVGIIEAAQYEAIVEGLTRFAWWNNGVEYVGTCGTTLKEAIADVRSQMGLPK
jgi:hypothetical protein